MKSVARARRRPRRGFGLVALLTAGAVVSLIADGKLPLATDGPDLPALEAIAVAFLLLAAAAAARIADRGDRSGLGLGPWLGTAGFLAFLAVQTGTQLDHVIHAHGIHWQLVYAPVTLTGAVAMGVAVSRLRIGHVFAARLVAAGSLIWVCAVGVWSLGWGRLGGPLSFGEIRLPERALEAGGSMLLALGLLWAVHSIAPRSSEEEIAQAIRFSSGGTNRRRP